jgi:membrane peptidoglycan carboxypeptidase
VHVTAVYVTAFVGHRYTDVAVMVLPVCARSLVVTVAVWVGNFDGSPMEGVSGVTGAGPLFHAAMLAAQALYPGASRAPLRALLVA